MGRNFKRHYFDELKLFCYVTTKDEERETATWYEKEVRERRKKN